MDIATLPQADGRNLAAAARPMAAGAAVCAVAAAVMFSGLGATKLDSHESFVVSTARSMARPQSWIDPEMSRGLLVPNTPWNHWMLPVYNARPRLEKPPLPYWTLAGLARLGLPLTEFVGRLPSAISAIILCVVTFVLGRRLVSRRAAWLGAIMLATSVCVYDLGHSSRADMLLCLLMTAAMALAHVGLAATGWRRQKYLLAAWAALAAANLCKPAVPLFLIWPLGVYACWQVLAQRDPEAAMSRWRRVILMSFVGLAVALAVKLAVPPEWWQGAGLGVEIGRGITLVVGVAVPLAVFVWRCRPWAALLNLLPVCLLGVALSAGAVLPWMWYMQKLMPEAGIVFVHELIERAMGTGGWIASAGRTLGYYPPALFGLVLPWSLFLPGAAAMPFMKRFKAHRNGLVFLMSWVAGIVLLFTASTGKHRYYVLPALPALCLLIGVCAEEVFFNNLWLPKLVGRIVAWVYASAPLAAAAVAAVMMTEAASRGAGMHLMVIAALVAPVAAWVAWSALRWRPHALVVSLLLAVTLAYAAFGVRSDLWDRQRRCAMLAAQAAAVIPRDERVIGWGDIGGTVIYYFDRPVPIAQVFRQHWKATLGPDKAQQRWQEYLQAKSPLWMLTYAEYVPRVEAMGFRPVAGFEFDPVNHDDILVMRRLGQPGPAKTQ
ncbi:MAG: glycosyltransferase family 39 protein [Planctomycetaceae bacterium]|nr:glycosyltransferase family 39 protein [Planctomycetaceae bacterium]